MAKHISNSLWAFVLSSSLWMPGYPLERIQATDSAHPIATTPCNQHPGDPPTSAVFDLDHHVSDWGVFCEGTPIWTMEQVTTPSLDGQALRCGLAGGGAYSNVHCYRDLRAEPESTAFAVTLSFRFSPHTTCNNQSTASMIQALEFSASKWHASQRYEFALQWQNVGTGAPQWRYWDPHQPSDKRWVPISPPITSCLTGNVWHTLTLIGAIRRNQVHYQAFLLNNQRYDLDITIDPVPTTAFDHLAVAVQLDGNYAQMPYDLVIDQVSFVRTAPPISPLYHVYVPHVANALR